MRPPAPRNLPYRSHHKRAGNAVRTATMVLVLLTAVLVGHVGAARPAHAAGSHQLCLPIVGSGHIVGFVCHDIWYRNPRACSWCQFPLAFEVGCDSAPWLDTAAADVLRGLSLLLRAAYTEMSGTGGVQ
jgi:hypothetical protein